MLTFSSDTVEERNNEIFGCLPLWKTHVLAVQKSDGDVPEVKSLKFLVSIRTRDEFSQWLQQFQDLTKATYTIRSTGSASGKYIIFTQRLVCQHNIRTKKIHGQTVARTTKNTNCPSKITVRIHAVHDLYKGRNKEQGQLHKDMPCEIYILLEHNHSIGNAESLRYRQPSDEVKDKLIALFNKGHSPGTALDSIKLDIQLNCPDYPLVLADRNRCPDYNFCYSLYSKTFKKKYGPMVFSTEGKRFLQQMLDEYNLGAGTVCSKMLVKDEDYAICICSPLMQRVHKHVKTAGRLVFMDSTGSLDTDGSRVFVLLTHSDCGGLPLGIVITSSESCEVLEMGLQLLKDITGENIFGGNVNGPSIFLTDDSQSEQNAIRRCFPNSKVLLCVFHVLQAVWRWLVKAKHGIPQQKQCEFFQSFRAIMFAKTKNEALVNYNTAKGNIGENHPNYMRYLESYWDRRDQWAVSYRIGLLVEGQNTNNISEGFMRILKDKIFERVKAFNVVQMVDFVLSKVNLYFQRRLLDAANRPGHKSFSRPIKVPSEEVLQKIKHVNGDILLVPSEDKANHYYIVNMAVLICTCVQGNTGKICKHIDWASAVLPSDNYREAINNTAIRRLLYFIATNEMPPEKWLDPLYESESVVDPNAGISMEMEVDLNSAHTLEELSDNSAHILEELSDNTDRKETEEANSQMLGEIKTCLANFTQRSPEEMGKALKKFLETLQKIKTPSACASHLTNFGEGKSRKNRGKYIAVQPTAISRRKTNLIGRKSHPGGRPRSLPKTNRVNMETAEICDMAHSPSHNDVIRTYAS